MFLLPIFVALGIGVFLLIADGLCNLAVKKSKERLESYEHKVIELSSGAVAYVDRGEGDVILSIHGILGGYDQGFETAVHFGPGYRIIAPSRFGYLGSDLPESPGPKEQAKIFKELLDSLEVDRVYLLAVSAGCAVAIKFALEYPERTKGLILYSPIAPLKERVKICPKYISFPAFICNNFGMWMASLFFEPATGMDRKAIYSMLPIEERRDGMFNDTKIVMPDMALNFDDYPIEDLQAPALLFQARDDKIAKCELMEQALVRFPVYSFVEFKAGGHFLNGNSFEIAAEEEDFLKSINSISSISSINDPGDSEVQD